MHIRELLKLASPFDGPDKPIDNAAAARADQMANRQDTRATLKGLFDEAGPAERADSALVNKLLPRGPRETGDPLLKLASQIVASAQVGYGLFKTASPSYLQVMHLGLRNELEKIHG